MKTYKNLYTSIYNLSNLFLAWRKARKGKTKRGYVKEFEKDTLGNLLLLHEELKNETYYPKPLKIFILRDPKTRKISKSDFRDRVVHHALINLLEPIFDKTFIYDSCANRKGKGNLFALKRFDKFVRKVSRNGKITFNKFNDNNYVAGFCLKADIKRYFETINHKILINLIKRKINNYKVICLIEKILNNFKTKIDGKGMPLGNLTSQFFANIYLHELDYFVKHILRSKYYIRYVDDFVILNDSKSQLNEWVAKINIFLQNQLNLELHPEKSKIIPLSKGIGFVGFKNFYYFRLLRKRNIMNMERKIKRFNEELIANNKFIKTLEGWQAYAKWADSYNLIKRFTIKINS